MIKQKQEKYEKKMKETTLDEKNINNSNIKTI